MAQFNLEGATVYTRSGRPLGEVQGIRGEGDDAQLQVKLNDTDRVIHLPYIFLDAERSEGDDLYLTLSEDSELEPYLADTEGFGLHLERVEEELVAHVNEVVHGRYIIEKSVVEEPERQDIELVSDAVDVQRIPMDEILNDPPQSRREGDTLIIPVVEEVLVVEKRYKVVEEVRVDITRETRTETVEDTLKKERLVITEERADGTRREH